MAIFDNEITEKRKERFIKTVGDNPPIILVGAGTVLGIPGGLDQTYPFIPHPDYYWLTGSWRSGGVAAFDADEGWTHFIRPVTKLERLWEGDPDSFEGEDIAALEDWMKAREGWPTVVLGSPVGEVEGDAELTPQIQECLNAGRRRKDAAELEVLDRAVKATAAGHARASTFIGPGVTEREIQIELESEMFRNGAHGVGYGTIVGVGSHAAILHFSPGERKVGPEDLVLIDAGGSIDGYTADVTRTYPGGEAFTPEQQAIYDVVLEAEKEGVSQCRIGTEWHEVHGASARVLALGLRDLGIMKGDVDGLLEFGAIALFLPHGIGHMVGLGVRDVGGRALDRDDIRSYCGIRIRVDLPLEDQFLMTVEPGIYFVPGLLDDPEKRETFRDMVDWNELERWRKVGGVRIEDNVLVTEDGPKSITEEIPK
ncbi:MAG: aminopeptidase [Gemmatimonadetes bacterium]|nr:aminopeptidase [Gemmatimonadota bacterium]